jgi:putative oxidoreductase
MFLESVGGVCLIIGLFTRFFAAALAIEMLIALFAAHWARGFLVSQGGYEFVLLLGAVCFAIAIRAMVKPGKKQPRGTTARCWRLSE